ncbi:MAG: alanine racemase [Bacteroidota bacterium]
MKLELTYSELCSQLNGKSVGVPFVDLIQEVVYDTRKINPSAGLVFFALNGPFRCGESYISAAYDKGVRVFVVHQVPENNYLDASFIVVDDTLAALQMLAKSYRDQLTYPILAIAGSLGKTTVKEWLYHLIAGKLEVFRSPKSYNSQLGVALSILQLPKKTDLAIIEVAATKPGEMKVLADMLRPTHGILTNLLPSHANEFNDFQQYSAEICYLFNGVNWLITSEETNKLTDLRCQTISVQAHQLDSLIPFQDEISMQQSKIAIAAAEEWISVDEERIKSLPHLAMRLETFEGNDGALIINDTYTMDKEAFKSSLSYQLSIAGSKHRIVLIGLSADQTVLTADIRELCQQFEVDEVHFLQQDEELTLALKNAVVLVKGARYMQRVANRLKLKQHKTQLSYNLSALKYNLNQYKNSLHAETKMLAMVKAQSYGAGLTTMAQFLEKQGIHYFGVAYSDEGKELRKSGIKSPILVMNAEEEGMETCVEFDLEPAIYDFNQLDELLKVLISQEKTAFPIHIKMDTGMKRLGFYPDEVQQLIEVLAAQPEVMVKSVYSHLAEADEDGSTFTQNQISQFEESCQQFESYLSYPFLRHILNSEGIAHYPNAQFDLVRIGIGLFGLSSNRSFEQRLKPVIEWTSSISQVKTIRPGESVGYGRTFVAEKDMRIAIIPIGYADGFKRSLSNGVGAVYIQNQRCPVVGRVCMDMIMVNIGELKIEANTKVEIIGKNQGLSQFAKDCQTIPYEILTSISPRVHRSYSEEE